MRMLLPLRDIPLMRVALLPVLLAALIPKCPVCIAVYLSAAGIGMGFAQGAAPWVIRAANGAAAGVLALLCFRLLLRMWRKRAE
jgi:hypothetical protein